jgi:hypothetical protein
MPFSRLSVRSALSVGRNAVVLHRRSGVDDLWFVRTHYPPGSVAESAALPKLMAKAVRRERRIFVALRVAGVDEVLAAQLATKGGAETRDWRTLVSRYIEQYKLTR